MVSVRDSHFDSDYEFTTDQGFAVAFALTAYDDNPERIEDPTIGTLKAYYKTWGIKEGSQGVDFEELPIEYCTRSQLGLPPLNGSYTDSQKPLFFKAHENSVNDVKFYYKKFKCIKSKNLRVRGDYNSSKARSLVIQFEKCKSTPFNPVICKTDQQINDWVKRKFIVTYTN